MKKIDYLSLAGVPELRRIIEWQKLCIAEKDSNIQKTGDILENIKTLIKQRKYIDQDYLLDLIQEKLNDKSL